jgi:hypothetical protein
VKSLRRTIVVMSIGCALTACGGEGNPDPAIEAQEGNQVRLGTVSYRVVTFRELNPRTAPDRSLVESYETPEGHGLYAAFIEACNRGDEPVTPTAEFSLEDAFGTAYQPVRSGLEPDLAYSPRRLGSGECLPSAASVADRTFGAAPLVFDVPYDITQERPLILEIREHPDGGDVARIQLDL